MKKIVDSKTTNVEKLYSDDKKMRTTIEQLINASYENSINLTENELIDEMLTMFMAVCII